VGETAVVGRLEVSVEEASFGTPPQDHRDDAEIAHELKEFLDRLIVPLLVERLSQTEGHLYSGERSEYDQVEELPIAA
jgi:hypothetical protein